MLLQPQIPLEGNGASRPATDPVQATQESRKSSLGCGIPPISSQSSVASSTGTTTTSTMEEELTPSYLTTLMQRANDVAEGEMVDGETKDLLLRLTGALGRARTEANQYKLHSQLLSMTSKDQDMRNEVEQELVKREVDRLKSQGGQIDYLMGKVTRQKALVQRYKEKIVEKNKEIIRLRARVRGKKNTSISNGVGNESAMLDTLGLLASQVLTEENGQDE